MSQQGAVPQTAFSNRLSASLFLSSCALSSYLPGNERHNTLGFGTFFCRSRMSTENHAFPCIQVKESQLAGKFDDSLLAVTSIWTNFSLQHWREGGIHFKCKNQAHP